ncbi:MAG: hypothetical protein AABY15_04270 [Nanoarchaeota archaeon]
MPGIDKLARATLQSQGITGGISSEGNQSSRNIYPAIVINNEDPLGMKRVVARIVSLDESGNINGGRDRDTPTDKLPFCVPMMPNHFHIVPLVDEMIYVFLENPGDNSAPRYYMGSEINSPFKLKFQAYAEAERVFKYTNFNLNQNKDNNLQALTVIPKIGDIAVQGRSDADLILRPREVFLVAGKFNKGTLDINQGNPSSLQLIQKENPTENSQLIPNYSQANFVSTNINLYSTRGKFRDSNLAKFEVNEDLKSFGDLANTLHPAVYGDELIKLLNIIITVLLNHIHTPQLSLVTTPDSDELSSYTVDGNLQRIISNHIRIN